MEKLSICGRTYGHNFILRIFVIMQWFMDILNQFWSTYSERIEFLLHTNSVWTTVFSILILIWIISFILFLPLHRLALNKVKTAKQNLINSVDKLVYLLSKAQYSLSEQQTLQYDPCFALMKTMFWTWHFEYIDNLDTIKENVKKVELLLKQRVISDDEWKKIDNQKSSLKFHTFWNKFFGYELNAVTFGVYNLFW